MVQHSLYEPELFLLTHYEHPFRRPRTMEHDLQSQKRVIRMLKERDRVRRISSVLATAFLQFRQATWHTHVQNVEVLGDFLYITNDSRAVHRYNGWWAVFPDSVAIIKDQKTKDALLTTLACYDTAHMSKLAEQLFKGMDMILEEVVLRPKSIIRRSIIHYDDKRIDFNDYDFWVVRVTSRTTGQQWAIHIAGAQYYMDKPFSLWHDFTEQWVHKILAVRPFGTLERYAKAKAQTKGTVGLEADMQIQAMQAWHEAVDPAMARKSLTWQAVLGKNEPDFRRHSAKILRAGMAAVEAFTRDAKLTKRRLKAERYEKRHGDWAEECVRIAEDVMEYKPLLTTRFAKGYTWLLSGHEPPNVDRVDVSRLKEA
ncbi:hypothetical protein DE146DRAFT_455846 [Phaeosphaeria sp. MPI-PUGE-AT-0046c]|nr:hypothetical protein DE146DRAFT_455846 [Phaeosphaeria sp. MPI-PUGE-AT-0046c]